MSGPNNAREMLVVTTNRGDYYIIPVADLEQFRAGEEARGQIEATAGTMVPGSFVRLGATEASTQSSFASLPKTTLLAWFQNIQ